MAAMQKQDIRAVVQILRERGAFLYHACQLKDFRSYLQLGGVPSRQMLERNGLPYTKFDTDESDHESDVWDKVFLNMQDFGIIYAKFGANMDTLATPNPYGPVLLVFEPEVLLAADDLSITLRSAGADGFDRHRESLSEPEHVHQLFKHVDPDEAPNDFARAYVAFTEVLQQRFNWSGAKSVEINCDVQGGVFPFQALKEVLVDEYNFGATSLRQVLNEALAAAGRAHVRVRERAYVDNDRVYRINQLAELLAARDLTLEELAKLPNLPAALSTWVARLRQGKVDFNFNRFAKYLRHGTLLGV